MNMIILSLCTISFKVMGASPMPSERPGFSERLKNMTLNSVRNAYPPRPPGSGQEAVGNSDARSPEENLGMNKFSFIIYAGQVISTLYTDPRYNEMKEKLKDPKSTERSLLNMLAAMSNSTRSKLDKIKSAEAQKYLKKCPLQKGGTEPPKPDFLDLHEPEKFNVIDLHLVIAKVASMRSVLETFLQGKT